MMDFFVLSSRRAPSYWIAVKEFELGYHNGYISHYWGFLHIVTKISSLTATQVTHIVSYLAMQL